MFVYEKFLKHREIKILSKFSKGPRASNFVLKILTLCKRRTDRNTGSFLMAWEPLGVYRTEVVEMNFLLIILYRSNLVLKVICLNFLWWLFDIRQALFMTVTIKLFALLATPFLVEWTRIYFPLKKSENFRCFSWQVKKEILCSVCFWSAVYFWLFYTIKHKENVKIMSTQK